MAAAADPPPCAHLRTCTLQLTAVQPFTKTGGFEVHCRCSSPEVRQKWITGLNRVIPASKFFYKK